MVYVERQLRALIILGQFCKPGKNTTFSQARFCVNVLLLDLLTMKMMQQNSL